MLRHISQTIVGTNAWVANFNKDIFGGDAMIFRPERWLESTPAQLAEMDNYFLTVGAPQSSHLLLLLSSHLAECLH